MKKKSLAKKIVKIFFIIFLVFSLLNSCSPLNSYAVTGNPIIDSIMLETRYFSLQKQFIGDLQDFSFDFFSKSKDWFQSKLIADTNRANNNNSDFKSYPYYAFTGKVVEDYFNINSNVNDVEYRDINYLYFATCTNYNPANRNSLQGYNTIVPSEFYSGTDVPQIGTIFVLRTNVDVSTGEILSAKRYALVPKVRMPDILYENTGSVRFYLSGTFDFYIDGVKISTLSFSDNYSTLYNNSVNSAVYRNGLSFYPSDSDFFAYSGNWNRWYINDISTNNQDFYNSYTTILNSIYINSPMAKPPVSFVGLPMGTIINNDNINNYNYITYNNDTNNYSFDTYDFGLDFDNTIKSQLQLDFDNVYKNQPLPGVSFDSDIIYNYLDLFSVPLSSDYLPSEWLDNYGSLDTHPNINIDDFLSVPTQTFNANLIQDMGVVTSSGMDLLDVFGLASPFLALALLGVLFKFFD